MKKILICLAIAGVGLLNTGCNDWLDVLPKNETYKMSSSRRNILTR